MDTQNSCVCVYEWYQWWREFFFLFSYYYIRHIWGYITFKANILNDWVGWFQIVNFGSMASVASTYLSFSPFASFVFGNHIFSHYVPHVTVNINSRSSRRMREKKKKKIPSILSSQVSKQSKNAIIQEYKNIIIFFLNSWIIGMFWLVTFKIFTNICYAEQYNTQKKINWMKK